MKKLIKQIKTTPILIALLLSANGIIFAQAPDSWSQKAALIGKDRWGAVGFSIGSKGYMGTGSDSVRRKDFWEYDPLTNIWTQKADFGGSARMNAVGFSIGSRGYIGMGNDNGQNDFWEYNPVTNTWAQKASLAGGARDRATGFSIGNKGYIGLGYDINSFSYKKDFWEYDPATNAWTKKADFGGAARLHAVGFSITGKGYAGTGSYYNGTAWTYYGDFWQYNPDSDAWVQKAGYGGGVRDAAAGFSLNDKGYIGIGYDGTTVMTDFWEYDPSANMWVQKASRGLGQGRPVSFSIGSKGYIGTHMDDPKRNEFWEYIPSLIVIADTWAQRSDFGGTLRERGVAFSIGGKGYLGTGYDGSANLLKNDFWEWDQATSTWTQKANFAGGARQNAIGFSIGSKGYLGTGQDYSSVNYGLKKDFWEYDPSTNTWLQKDSFAGTERTGATGFSIGQKGYIGTGTDGPNSRRQDFWEYNPATNAWVQKADFGGVGRDFAIGFSIGNRGYLGTGDQGGSNVNDFWEYSAATNSWMQKADFGGTSRGSAVGFSIGNKGYVGTGNNILSGNTQFNDFWEWNQATDTWAMKASFPGVTRSMSTGFSIGNKGYIGTGVNKTSGDKKDFWEYAPDSMLFLGTDTLKFSAAQSNKGVTITSNLYWTISGPPSWVSISAMNGIGVAALTISIQKNLSASSRQTDLTVTTGNISRNLHIFQSGLTVNKWLGADQQELDINNVRAAVTSLNTTFRDININTGAYHVPKTDNARSTTFTSTIWLGGISNNNIYMAAETYRQSGFDFHHGPVSKQYFPAVPNTWAKVWKLSKKEVEDFKASGIDSGNMITTWPGNGAVSNGQAAQLSMVYDLNNNGIYEPSLGEYPLIKGDQTLFAIFNDDTIHTEETDNPARMKVEIQRYNYAFKSSSAAINNTTFADYKIINRTNRTYDTLVFTAYMDFDIGNYADDYIGTDSSRKMIYAYNGGVFDSTAGGYGVNPPAQACVFLNQRLDNSMFYNNGSTSIMGNPLNSGDYLNYMSGTWKDGKSLTYGNNGYNGTLKTKYAFSGDPCNNTGWWEGSVPNPPDDRRILGSTFFYNVGPFEEIEVKLAYVFARGNNGHISSVCDLKAAVDSVVNFYNANPDKFPSNILSADPSVLNYSNMPGSKQVKLVCNTGWTAIANQPWITLNKASGNGNDSIHVIVNANTGQTPRLAKVIFTAGPLTQTVSILQDSTPLPPDSLSLDKDSVYSNSKGDTTTVTVKSNRSWAVSSNQSWAAIYPFAGSGNGSFTLTTPYNPTVLRNALVTVTAGSLSKTVNLTQDKATGAETFIAADNILIYPNPSSGIFTINFNQSDEKKLIQVYDLTGIMVKEARTDEKLFQLNLEGFPKGVFVLRFYIENKIGTQKIMLLSEDEK